MTSILHRPSSANARQKRVILPHDALVAIVRRRFSGSIRPTGLSAVPCDDIGFALDRSAAAGAPGGIRASTGARSRSGSSRCSSDWAKDAKTARVWAEEPKKADRGSSGSEANRAKGPAIARLGQPVSGRTPVHDLVAEGVTNLEIADELAIPPDTVRAQPYQRVLKSGSAPATSCASLNASGPAVIQRTAQQARPVVRKNLWPGPEPVIGCDGHEHPGCG